MAPIRNRKTPAGEKGGIKTNHLESIKDCACPQDQLLQLMDGLPDLFNSSKGLSAAIYTQVSDVEAEVNGELTSLMQELL